MYCRRWPPAFLLVQRGSVCTSPLQAADCLSCSTAIYRISKFLIPRLPLLKSWEIFPRPTPKTSTLPGTSSASPEEKARHGYHSEDSILTHTTRLRFGWLERMGPHARTCLGQLHDLLPVGRMPSSVKMRKRAFHASGTYHQGIILVPKERVELVGAGEAASRHQDSLGLHSKPTSFSTIVKGSNPGIKG